MRPGRNRTTRSAIACSSKPSALLNDDAAYIPLYYYATRHLVKPYLRGWQSNVMDRNLSRYMYLLEHQGALSVLRYTAAPAAGARFRRCC